MLRSAAAFVNNRALAHFATTNINHTTILARQSFGTKMGIATQTIPLQMPLSEFRDSESRQKRLQEMVGRSWTVKELRRKNFDDLQKLWLVLYKERNMLLTEQQISRRRKLIFPQPERFRKVQKSMGAIRHVLGERKLAAIAAFKEEKRQEELLALEEGEDEDDVGETVRSDLASIQPAKA